MSSMVKRSLAFALLASAGLLAPLAARAQASDENAWDRARAALRAQGPTNWAYAIDRWKTLSASNRFASIASLFRGRLRTRLLGGGARD